VPSKNRVEFPGVGVEVAYYRLRDCVEGEAIAAVDRRVRSECGPDTIVLGLPGEPPDPCALAVAYLHALEHVAHGGRVRSLSLRTLMELYGYRQVREAVEALSRACYIAVVGRSIECASRIVEGLGVEEVEVGECDPERIAASVERGVMRGLRGKT